MRAALAAFSCSCLFGATASAADYSVDGPLAVTVSDLPNPQAGAHGGKLVVPNGAGPYPLVVASHGFSATADNQVGWAKHFATYGFVVVVPTFPGTDHATNGKIVQDLVALYANPSTVSPAQGHVDGSKAGLEGHSAGGLATAIAGAALQPKATILFDPVDNNGLGQAAMGKIAGPLLEIFADSSSCNSSSGWSAFKSTSLGAKVYFNVIGSTHCDGENADRGVLCGLVCGGAADPMRQARYAHYATAALLAFLDNDAAAAAALCETTLAADSAIKDTDSEGVPGCSASVPPDLASTGSDMALEPEDFATGNALDFAVAGSGGVGGNAAGGSSNGSAEGCGCKLGSRDETAAPAMAFVLVIAWLVVNARASRRREAERGEPSTPPQPAASTRRMPGTRTGSR